MTPTDYCAQDLGHAPGPLEYAQWFRTRAEQFKKSTGQTLESPSARERFRVWLRTRPSLQNKEQDEFSGDD